MRKINRIVVHCTAGKPTSTVASVQAGWKAQGWKKPGYHYIIASDGTTTNLATDDTVVNGAHGYNADSMHVCYIGGLQPDGKYGDTRTEQQKAALLTILKALKAKYKVPIVGHRDLSPDLNGNGKVDQYEWIKVCPCFDAQAEYKNI